ncbi:hypothetical protein [Leptolyngbya sp. 'hensonii']|uniref:hypothetical protein n=1 Tax=Leptolyngbya sp. 'hensonii' TaxID=1922337 RepID=UPI000AC20735|nr:hypothetical protein [Leptolyngbya sp. 'hensonii']
MTDEPKWVLVNIIKVFSRSGLLVVYEHRIRMFKFWMDDQVKIGMCLRDEFYIQSDRFLITEKQLAFDLACKLLQDATQVVVTISRSNYMVWRKLSPT